MPVNGHGLEIIESNENDPRLKFYRFKTPEIEWGGKYPGPGVNVLLPTAFDSATRYPVLYLLHGGNEDFRTFDLTHHIRDHVDQPIIIVMPDGGRAGWYSNPVNSNVGKRNWEDFHINHLIPWIDGNFHTHRDRTGRAVAGFSMGGFGALKYAGRFPDTFSSASAHSGPASLRHDFGIITNWANATSAAVELLGGTIYGIPWDQAKVRADDPCEDVNRYRYTRLYLVSGDSNVPISDVFGRVNELVVRDTQNIFVYLLRNQGMTPTFHPVGGGHAFRIEEFKTDLKELIAYLKPAGPA